MSGIIHKRRVLAASPRLLGVITTVGLGYCLADWHTSLVEFQKATNIRNSDRSREQKLVSSYAGNV